MFYESGYPKNELKSISIELEKYSRRFLLYNNWIYNLEKNCFIWFYFVRKLLESKFKVTDRIRHLKVNVKTYKFIWRRRHFPPFWDIDEYDYENPEDEILTIRDLTHQFVHSQLFFWWKEWKWLKHIFVASDRMLYEKIYKIDINDIIEVFKVFSEDYVTKISSTYDEESDRFIVNCS